MTPRAIAAALREWLQRVRATVVPPRGDRDLEQELQLHLEMAADEARRRGESPDRARRTAAIHAGGVAQAMDALRDQRGLPWLDDLMRDVRHAFRFLRRSPVFAAVAIVSLALGIGANAAIFSLADASLLRPLPVRDPDRIVTITAAGPGDRRGGVSYPNYRDLRDLSRSFDGLIAHQRATFSFARSTRSAAEMRLGTLVSDNFFSVLGVQPALGRTFTSTEGAVPGRDAVVVLGYDFWKNALGEDRSIVGQPVKVNGIDFTVVGVAGERFSGVDPYIRPAFYAPLMMMQRLSAAAESPLDDRGERSFVVKGRLKSGESARSAQAELATIWRRLQAEHPDVNATRILTVATELQSRMRSDPTTAVAMTMLMTLVAIVLIIACANVANLMLGRARTRSREIAIRLALGVSRTRLLRQLLTESVVLAIIGAAAGLVFAYVGIRLFQGVQVPSDLPIVIDPRLDGRVLIFSGLAASMSAIVFGIAPAWHSLSTRLVPALKSSEPGQTSRHRTIGRNVLVVAQIALSMALLVGTGVLLSGFLTFAALDPGFRTDHVMTLSLDTSFVRYAPVQTREFYRRLVDRARALPGVRSVALTSAIPLDRGGSIESVIPEGYELPPGHDTVPLFGAVVDDEYFATMKTQIVRGRAFTAADTATSRNVVVVNEEFVKTYWPDGDPVGKRVRLNDSRGPWLEVVGVAKTGKYLFIGEAPMRFMYLPFAQHQRPQMSLLVETTADASSLAAPLRDVVRGIDANQPVFNLRALSNFYEYRAIAVPRALVRMVGTMAVLGLILALVGLYGLVAYSVARRTREIGIRMAIGAGSADVLKMVLRQGFIISLAGIVTGAAASIAVVRLLGGFMPGAGAPNPATYVIVPVILMGLTMAASYFPARSASLVDPLVALRDE